MTLLRGWCPGALRPMPSGDGLILRIRPPAGRLSPAQVEGIAAIAEDCGNGAIEFTRRANVQIRGISAATLAEAQARLVALGLLEPDLPPEAEARLNILVTPFWPAPGLPGVLDPLAVWAALRRGLVAPDAPALPAKFGFALDLGWRVRHLQDASADVRIESAPDGGVLVRADGAATGRPVASAEEAAEAALALARWFVASGGVGADGRGRMRDHLARGALPPGALSGTAEPAPPAVREMSLAFCIGFDFGAASPDQLRAIAAAMNGGALHVTPWRAVHVPRGAGPVAVGHVPGLILVPGDPRWRRFACVGAPRCAAGRGDPRAFARRHALLPPPGRVLHLSGCAKGCAHPGPADVTITCAGRHRRLALDARAGEGRRATLARIRAALEPADAPQL